MKENTKGIIKTVVLLTGIQLILLACQSNKGIELVSPTSGIKISSNIPTLTWKTSNEFTNFEIWVDGYCLDTIEGYRNFYVPFPLSYGNHQWHVVGIKATQRVSSEPSTFRVDDKPMRNLPEQSILLREGWNVKSAFELDKSGEQLSTGSVSDSTWAKTSIPATVLTALVRNGIYPNPYIGINNMYIPDCNDAYNEKYNLLKYSHIAGQNPWKQPYWYVNTFTVPDSVKGEQYWITFSEINYKAEVWLNGQLLADTNLMVGMEREFRLNITHQLKANGQNNLAMAIYPPNNPGKPDPEPLEPFADPGTNMADGMISKDYTKWDVLGWDWIPPIRDRDMGITGEVIVSATKNIEITEPYVTTQLNLPDTSQAKLTVSALVNNYGTQNFSGYVTVTVLFDDTVLTLSKPVTVMAMGVSEISFTPEENAELNLQNPKLWWPVGYGNPNLYKMELKVSDTEGSLSACQVKFGVRKVETYLSDAERVYKLNGRKIYVKGGNWVEDMMLNWHAQRYYDEIWLTKNSGLNMLRVWGPTGVPPQAFFDAADELGILIWQDFLNDFWGTFKNTPGYFPQESIFKSATIDIVKKLRNHASLVIWCGGNEGPNPLEGMIMNEILPKYDGRDSKHYLKISNGDGLHGGGPYHTLKPREYFGHHQLRGFSSEIGPSGFPVYESMVKMTKKMAADTGSATFPVTGEWAYHDATDRQSDNRRFSFYDQQVRVDYGKPSSVNDYCQKAQILNYDVYRASIESINRQLWDKASGIALWKSNSCWPSLIWQIYDYYLQANAGYYGVKKASEMVHVQWNRDDNTISVINLKQPLKNAKVQAIQYDTNLKPIWNGSALVNVEADAVVNAPFKVNVTRSLTLLKLMLLDANDKLLSENLYWQAKNDDFAQLRNMAPTELKGSALMNHNANSTIIKLEIKNAGKSMAFMTNIILQEKESGTEILPALYSDNYLTLLPGESKNLTIEVASLLNVDNVVISCIPYNSGSGLLITPKQN